MEFGKQCILCVSVIFCITAMYVFAVIVCVDLLESEMLHLNGAVLNKIETGISESASVSI